MAMAITGLMSAISTSLRNAARLTDYDRAVLFGRQKMDELLIAAKLPKLTPFEGTWDDTITGGLPIDWRARLTPFEMPPNAGPGAPFLERMELEIWWMNQDRRRSFTLEGFRRGRPHAGRHGRGAGSGPVTRQRVSRIRRAESGVTLMELLIAVTLLSLLSVGIVISLRVALSAMNKADSRLTGNRRVTSVQRILEEQIQGIMPVTADCQPLPRRHRARSISFFQGETQSMRLASTYSLQQGARGLPMILEFQVIPGEDSEGVRLVVNEHFIPARAAPGCSAPDSGPTRLAECKARSSCPFKSAPVRSSWPTNWHIAASAFATPRRPRTYSNGSCAG